jgi:hypothetical protein
MAELLSSGRAAAGLRRCWAGAAEEADFDFETM